jgi:hypothetical protein
LTATRPESEDGEAIDVIFKKMIDGFMLKTGELPSLDDYSA